MKNTSSAGSAPEEEQRLDSRSSRVHVEAQIEFFWIRIFVDGAISGLFLYFFTILRSPFFPIPYQILMVLSLLLMTLFYRSINVYEDNQDAVAFLMKLLRAWVSVALTLVALGFLTKTSSIFSRQILVAWILASFSAQFAVNILMVWLVTRFNATSTVKEKAILVGAGELAEDLADRVNGNKWLSTEIVGVLEDDEGIVSRWSMEKAPVLGRMVDLERVIEENNIKCVYITLPLAATALVESFYLKLLPLNVDIKWVPDLSGLMLINPNIKEIGGMAVFSLSETPLVGSRAVAKVVFDWSLAVMALVALSPVMLATAVAIKIMMPGPVFFRQVRHGWNGKEFNVWKFRSMVMPEKENEEFLQATRGDKRVTRLGHFLRKTSIDELPQLFNVITGDMSLVGPRPHPVALNDFYDRKIEAYLARHRIKPGITGLAQISGFRGETDTVEKMRKRVEYDLEYINNWSLALDMKILVKTVFVLFSKEAY
ncbi:MAG: undecaprenyl-phosphate glucose phosphotransferase [Nitrospinota bacterium]|nr:undecaprenyl-phosphate glucose phosphotransferase [Nitrospinota bacterium]